MACAPFPAAWAGPGHGSLLLTWAWLYLMSYSTFQNFHTSKVQPKHLKLPPSLLPSIPLLLEHPGLVPRGAGDTVAFAFFCSPFALLYLLPVFILPMLYKVIFSLQILSLFLSLTSRFDPGPCSHFTPCTDFLIAFSLTSATAAAPPKERFNSPSPHAHGEEMQICWNAWR